MDKKYTIKELMNEYLKFCEHSAATNNANSDKFGCFIGWLKMMEEINSKK